MCAERLRTTYHTELLDDPTIHLPEGTELHFDVVQVRTLQGERAATLNDWGASRGVVLALAILYPDRQELHGSGVMVSPGVALCATHVILQYLDDLRSGNALGLCVGTVGVTQRFWRIRQVAVDDRHDIALLGLSLASAMPEDRTFHQVGLSTRLPAMGERLICAGFRPLGGRQSFPVHEGVMSSISATIQVSSGTVGQRFPRGRDAHVLPYPSVEADFPAWGAMSGGPVFDERGFVVGLLSRSLETADEPSPSYVSLIWPALLIPFQWHWPMTDRSHTRTLLGSVGPMCFVDRPEAIRIVAGKPLCDEWS